MYERHADFEADVAIAKDPGTDETQFPKLLRKHHGDIDIMTALAQNPSCPQQLYVAFWRYVRPIAAGNPALEKYQAHEKWEIMSERKPYTRYYTWSSDLDPNFPAIHELLYVLEHGDSKYQRYAMALEAIPEQQIREQANSKSAPMRKVIAARKTAPNDVFAQLARDLSLIHI